MLLDNFGRQMDYLRVAVTDRCNLRCTYCMPEEGLQWMKRDSLLTYEEIVRALKLFADLGVTKVRFTGGEPFLRKDFMHLLEQTATLEAFHAIHITTNGTLTAPHVAKLKALGIKGVNLSLDTLNEERFQHITKRNNFRDVQETLHELLAHQVPLKINAVVMQGVNDTDIQPLAEFTREHQVQVRFLEEMPFNGGHFHKPPYWTAQRILEELKRFFPTLQQLPAAPSETAMTYEVPGFKGSIGIIASYSRSFCGTCNRIRLTPQGGVRTCLYAEDAFDLKTLMRQGMSDEEMKSRIVNAAKHKFKDGKAAEHAHKITTVGESMAQIGG
jgi:cyclic pyranopterin phosphate synthase